MPELSASPRLTPTERLILMSLRLQPSQTRTELAETTGSGSTQISYGVRTLVHGGLIVGTAESPARYSLVVR